MFNDHRFTPVTGVNKDLAPEDLPPGLLSDCVNAVPTTRGMGRAPGLTNTGVNIPEAPTALLPVPKTGTKSEILVAGQSDVFHVSSNTPTKINESGETYNATPENPWTMVNLNGAYALCNPEDSPQYWADDTKKLKALEGLPSKTRFKVIRAYKNYLLGLQVKNPLDSDNDSEFRSSTLMWSHSAEPGTVPSSWDIADPTKDAGTNILPSAGELLDSLQLGGANFLYKNDAVYRMSFIGGNLIFDFDPVFPGYGILATNCVQEFNNRHFVVGSGQIYLHDGVSVSEIGDRIVQEWFYSQLSFKYSHLTFVVKRPASTEMWVCFPEEGGTACTKALIWNWVSNQWGIRNIPPCLAGSSHQPFAYDELTWDTLPQADWDAWTGAWGTRRIRPFTEEILLASSEAPYTLLTRDGEDLEFGGSMDTRLERTALPLGPLSRDGQIRPDFDHVKLVTEVWPNVDTEENYFIRLGSQDYPEAPVEWGDEVEVYPDEKFIQYPWSGVYLAVQVRFHGTGEFVVRKLRFKFEVLGDY